jgi:hypothetical protein
MSPDQTLRSDPHPVLAARAWMVWVAVFFLAAMLLVTYQWGYSSGAKSGALTFAKQSNCRAELAVPVTKAQLAAQAATGIGLVAAVAADHPEVQRKLREIADETPDQVLRKEVIEIIDRSLEITRASKAQGDPFKRCEDGKP